MSQQTNKTQKELLLEINHVCASLSLLNVHTELLAKFLETQSNTQLEDLADGLTTKFFELRQTKESKWTESKTKTKKDKPTPYSIGPDNFYKFKEQIKIYISDEKTSNKNTLSTIISFLRDKAQECANDFYRTDLDNDKKEPDKDFLTAEEFLDKMEKYFGDPKRKDSNLAKMMKLRYMNSTTCFVHTFRHLAKQFDASEEEKKSWLRRSIPQSLRTQLLHHQTDSLEEQLLKIQLWGPELTIETQKSYPKRNSNPSQKRESQTRSRPNAFERGILDTQELKPLFTLLLHRTQKLQLHTRRRHRLEERTTGARNQH
jgi:hypothetical protein